MKKTQVKAYIAVGIVAFFWGTTYLATRVAVRYISGFYLSGLRQLISGGLLVLLFKIKGQPWPGKYLWKIIFVESLLLVCLGGGVLSYSMQFIPAGLAAVINSLIPVFVFAFSAVFYKVRYTVIKIVGLLLGIIGIMTIFIPRVNSPPGNFDFYKGAGLAVFSVISWSIGTLVTSKNKKDLPTLFTAGLQLGLGGFVMVLFCIITGKAVAFNHFPQSVIVGLLYLVLIGSMLTYSAYTYAISRLPPSTVSIYAYINPVVALLLGWWLLHEELPATSILGTAVTLTGVFLVSYSRP